MKKIASLISVVCLIALCFTLFASCAGNPDKVAEYVEKLNKEDNMYYVSSVKEGDKSINTEVIISEQKISVLIINGDEKQENVYIVDKDNSKKVRKYFKFDCDTHKDKNGKPMKEWKYEDIDVEFDYLAKTREILRERANVFELKKENIVYNKDSKGFVYAEGKAPAFIKNAGISDIVVNAKSGELSIAYKAGDADIKCSFMNFGSARVALPLLCPEFEKSIKK